MKFDRLASAHAWEHRDRSFPAQALRDRALDTPGIAAEPFPLPFVGKERIDQISERAMGRLAASRKEQADVREDFLICQASPVDFGVHELADHIVERRASALFDDRREKFRERLSGFDGAFGLVTEGEQRQRPIVEFMFPVARKSQQARDDEIGKTRRELSHQIELIAFADLVDQLGRESSEPLSFVARDGARTKGGSGEPSVTKVIDRVRIRDEALADGRLEGVFIMRWPGNA